MLDCACLKLVLNNRLADEAAADAASHVRAQIPFLTPPGVRRVPRLLTQR